MLDDRHNLGKGNPPWRAIFCSLCLPLLDDSNFEHEWHSILSAGIESMDLSIKQQPRDVAQLGAKKWSDTRSSGCLRVCVLPDNLIVKTQKSTRSTTSSWRNVKSQCVHDKHRRDIQNQHNKCPLTPSFELTLLFRKKKRSGSISHLSTDPQAINTEEEKRRSEFRLKTPAIRTNVLSEQLPSKEQRRLESVSCFPTGHLKPISCGI